MVVKLTSNLPITFFFLQMGHKCIELMSNEIFHKHRDMNQAIEGYRTTRLGRTWIPRNHVAYFSNTFCKSHSDRQLKFIWILLEAYFIKIILNEKTRMHMCIIIILYWKFGNLKENGIRYQLFLVPNSNSLRDSYPNQDIINWQTPWS